MKQSARPAVPRTRRRNVSVGALLATAALATGFVLAPVAAATDAGVERSRTWQAGSAVRAVPLAPLPPLIGSATLALQISGAAPADLDLAGVEFELVGLGVEPITGLCVTDATGSCAIEVVPDVASGTGQTAGSEIVLPAGAYSVRQLTAPVGLTPAGGIAPLELCVAPTPEGCFTSRTVINTSTYRTRTEIQVLSANGLVAGAEVTLTGPGFPATPAVTDEDGRGSWSGWFRPGEWWFAVAGQPAPLLMTMTAEQGDTSQPWRLELTLPSVAQPEVAAPAPAAATAAAPSSSGVQPAPAPAPGIRPRPAAVARVVPSADEPQEEVAPAPTPAPTVVPSPAESGNGQVFVAADGPALETEGSAQLLSAGLGILFVVLVLTGYGVLRSRQRRPA